jgi:XRE family transcriptional regulator, aerobic/anaerobic benzoate catabolism transcriptional regulator
MMAHDGFRGSQDMAQRLRALRARAGFTRKQLSAAAHASERYLAHLEAGTGNPSIEMLINIADALDISVTELLPMGGERTSDMAEAAQLLRRLPKSRLEVAMDWLVQPMSGPSGKARRISLIGLRGAGKSSLGAALAERLGVPFFEISKEVERRYGGTIGVLLEMNGPPALHRYEADVLEEICHTHKCAIIAAPGAIVSNGPLYDQLLGSSWSVWLQASPEDHMNRVIAQGDLRPMAGNLAAMGDLKAILSAREDDYARADTRLDTSKQGFDSTLDALEDLTACLPK